MLKTRWAAVAGVPVVVCVLVLAREAGFAEWAELPRPVLFGAIVDTLLANTALLIVGAPVVGVVLAPGAEDEKGDLRHREPRRTREVIPTILGAVVAFTATSAAICALGWGASAEATRAVAASHITLAAGGLMLAGFGAWCAATFRNRLDAVACSLGAALVAGCAVIVAGPAMADVPRTFVTAGLLASPLVATATAAGIDLFRTDVLYQVSPLAHTTLDYPAWQIAAGLYVSAGLACFGALARSAGRRAHDPKHD